MSIGFTLYHPISSPDSIPLLSPFYPPSDLVDADQSNSTCKAYYSTQPDIDDATSHGTFTFMFTLTLTLTLLLRLSTTSPDLVVSSSQEKTRLPLARMILRYAVRIKTRSTISVAFINERCYSKKT